MRYFGFIEEIIHFLLNVVVIYQKRRYTGKYFFLFLLKLFVFSALFVHYFALQPFAQFGVGFLVDL